MIALVDGSVDVARRLIAASRQIEEALDLLEAFPVLAPGARDGCRRALRALHAAMIAEGRRLRR